MLRRHAPLTVRRSYRFREAAPLPGLGPEKGNANDTGLLGTLSTAPILFGLLPGTGEGPGSGTLVCQVRDESGRKKNAADEYSILQQAVLESRKRTGKCW